MVPVRRFSPFALALVFCAVLAGGFQSRSFAQTVQPSGTTGPKIWLQDSQSVPVTHVASPSDGIHASGSVVRAARDLAADGAKPLSMAHGDFDQDGVEDLVVGYATPAGGSIALHRGNLDAFAPQSDESFRAIEAGRFPAPFLNEAVVFDIPVRPDFVAAGNFTGKNFLDLAVAAKGGTALYLLAGDGKGNFAPPQRVNLRGAVTALAAGELGANKKFSSLVVGVNGVNGADKPSLLVFSASQQGVTLRRSSPGPSLPQSPTARPSERRSLMHPPMSPARSHTPRHPEQSWSQARRH